MPAADPTCAVTIVTFNSARYIRQCLQTLFETHGDGLRVVVVDNGSSDETSAILNDFSSRIEVVYNEINRGFAGGQNQAIARTDTDWVLVLNPDVQVTRGFIPQLLRGAGGDRRIGTVCGKLLSMNADLSFPPRPTFDSTGIYFTGELRHFDRGSKEEDRGQFETEEYVFGGTGAAALYRREMIEDVAIGGEFFDQDFFAYREDADLAWRAQLLDWRCLYTPHAVAYHVRSVLPTNRRAVPALVNYHSVKNRFLMRIKNIDATLYARHFFAITTRDVLVFAGCLIREHSSLPAFVYVLRNWRRFWAKRRLIQARRRVPTSYMLDLFAPNEIHLRGRLRL